MSARDASSVTRCEVCGVQIPTGRRWCSYEPCARIALEHVGEPQRPPRRRWPKAKGKT